MSHYDPTDLRPYPPSYVTQVTTTTNPSPEPEGNPVLRFLTESLKRANVANHEMLGALAEAQAKADACTREREAIERAIKAYQHQESPNMRADR